VAIPAAGATMTDPEARELLSLAHSYWAPRPLSRFVTGLNPERLGPEGAGLFRNDPIVDALLARQALGRSVGRADAAVETIARTAQRQPVQQYGDVPADRVARATGLTRVGRQRIADAMGVPNLGDVYLPQDAARSVQGLNPRVNAPGYLQRPVELFDQLTNLFRSGVTVPWPGFHVRNLTNDAAAALMHGSTGALPWSEGAGLARDVRAGQAPAALAGLPIARELGLSADEARSFLGREAYAGEAYAHGNRFLQPTAERLASVQQGVLSQIPGALPKPGLADILTGRELPPDVTWSNPFAQEGFLGQTRTRFGPSVVGRQTADYVNEATGGGMWFDLLRQGYAPEAATALVKRTFPQYQYTPFESQFLRRIVPFYGYQRHVLPMVAGSLAREPGALAGQGIRLGDQFRQQDGFLPPYLGGGLAIPIGAEQEGTQRYLTKLDLPWEQPFDLFSVGPGAAGKTLMRTLGQLNPIIKGPLELGANRQFYTGRELDDLYSRTGIPMIDQLVMNSPAARVLSTGGTLLDARKDPFAKALNLLTGAKLSDVDMGKQRGQVALDMIRDVLNQDPNVSKFSNFSVRPQALGSLTPDEVEAMRLYRTLERDMAQAARRRRAGGP
jgi:hypothetical protein